MESVTEEGTEVSRIKSPWQLRHFDNDEEFSFLTKDKALGHSAEERAVDLQDIMLATRLDAEGSRL